MRRDWTDERIRFIESRLGYRFRDRDWLITALSHRTVTNGPASCYETLECLGDRTLKCVQMRMLIAMFPRIQPHHLTQLERLLLMNKSLTKVCDEHQLHQLLNFDPNALHEPTRHMRADMIEALFAAVDFDGGRADLEKLYLRLFKRRIREVVDTHYPHLLEARAFYAA